MGLILTSVLLLSLFYIYLRWWPRQRGRLPPGPKRMPIIGNALDVPPKGMPEYQHWLRHKDLYGPISSISIMGQTMVFLHDRESVLELAERRSTTTAGRPGTIFAHKLCGFEELLPLRDYDETFRKHRKMISQQIGTKALVAQFNDAVEAETGRLLLRLLEKPQDLVQHFRTQSAAVMLKIAYGYSTEPDAIDPLVQLIEILLSKVTLACVPLAWPVDLIPALRHLPEWLPGMSFQRTAREWNRVARAAIDIPYAFVEKRIRDGNHRPCYVSKHAEEQKDKNGQLSPEMASMIRSTAAGIYGGGSETTIASLVGLVLGMAKFPEVQKRAQEEIDSVTGSGQRLPTFEDRDHLPYVDALVKESLRWFPVLPMGLPHTTSEDMHFREYVIPKGAILMPAIRWLLHDPSVYADPECFDPARYLAPRNELDPSSIAFGFGRRACPGRQLADSLLFLTAAQLLASYDIRRPLGSEGDEVEPEVVSIPGVVDFPPSYAYRITPRSERHRSLIEGITGKDPWEESDAVDLVGVGPILEAEASASKS